MKQESQPEPQSKVNDRILREALAGRGKAYICVHRETKTVITNMGPRPQLYADPDASKFSLPTHFFVEVDPKDPFAMCDIEETPTNDRWVYVRPGPSEAEIGQAVEEFQKELNAVAPKIAEVLEEVSEELAPAVEAPAVPFSAEQLRDRERFFQDEFVVAIGCPLCGLPKGDPACRCEPERIVVRHSELVDASCLKRYELSWVKNLRPRRTDPKLAIGSMVHAFLEAYEPALTDTSAPKHMVWAHAKSLGFAALDKKLEEYVKALPENDAEGKAEAAEAWNLATQICTGYEKWRTIGDGSDLSPIQQSEATFNFEIGEIDGVKVILSGTMDGVGVTRVTDDADAGELELWLREYKTCKSILEKLKQYRLDKQTRRYVGAAQRQGVNFAGVELVLISKSLPLQDSDFLLKNGVLTRDKSKWAKASYEQALRVAEMGKFASPDDKNGLTEQGFHGILKILKDQPNPFFHVARLRFNQHELTTIMDETLMEGYRLHVTRETALKTIHGNKVWTRQQGPMGFNCKSCQVRDLCEMELKGVDTAFHIQEHFVVDNSIHAGKETDDTDD